MDKTTAIDYLMHRVGGDEPVFILRGNDLLAVPAILKWVDLAKDYRVPYEKIQNALTVAGEFTRHIGEKKIPD